MTKTMTGEKGGVYITIPTQLIDRDFAKICTEEVMTHHVALSVRCKTQTETIYVTYEQIL